jgi:hypothetical protein
MQQPEPLLPKEASKLMKPVMSPPGFAKLATKPLPIGSDAANTIGIVLVSACSAAVAGVVKVKITSGLSWTNSFANSRMRSTLPAPQRCPTLHPAKFAQSLRESGSPRTPYRNPIAKKGDGRQPTCRLRLRH